MTSSTVIMEELAKTLTKKRLIAFAKRSLLGYTVRHVSVNKNNDNNSWLMFSLFNSVLPKIRLYFRPLSEVLALFLPWEERVILLYQ